MRLKAATLCQFTRNRSTKTETHFLQSVVPITVFIQLTKCSTTTLTHMEGKSNIFKEKNYPPFQQVVILCYITFQRNFEFCILHFAFS